DPREIAGRELVVAEGADDLETRPVAEHIQQAPHTTLGQRRQRLSLGGRDRSGIYGIRSRWLHCSDLNQTCRSDVLYASHVPVSPRRKLRVCYIFRYEGD